MCSKLSSRSYNQKPIYFCFVLFLILILIIFASGTIHIASTPNTDETELETIQKSSSLSVGEFTTLKTKRRLSINETCSFYVNASTRLDDWWNPAHVVAFFVNHSLFEQWKASPGTPLPTSKAGGNDISHLVITSSSGYWYLIVYNDPEESDQSVDVYMSLSYLKIESDNNNLLSGFSAAIFLTVTLVASAWILKRRQQN
ncbi:MAG: hypothetical protein ACFFB3_13450 [Candidatus Hodarchaeota archaeon]